MIQFLNRITPAAEMAGAVNCILRDDRQLVGENTEGTAFLQTLRRRIDPAGKHCVLLGAGRVARAIAVELAASRAAMITVVDRREAAARHLVNLLTGRLAPRASLAVWEGDYEVPRDTEVLIHATPLGTGDEDARVPIRLESLASLDARGRPGDQSSANLSVARGRRARLPDFRRFGGLHRPDRRQFPAVDRGRPGPGGDAQAVEEFLEL